MPVACDVQTSDHLPNLENLSFAARDLLQNEEFVKSPLRLEIESLINHAHQGAQKEALLWCGKHPIRGVTALISMALRGEVNEKTVKEWQQLPSWKDYHSAYAELLKLEKTENFAAMKFYAFQLDKLQNILPEKLCQNAYYPFAGTDYYWSRIFRHTTFEDIGYNKNYAKNMWWEPESYSIESRKRIFSMLQQSGVLDQESSTSFLSGDANQQRINNDFNRSECTLIVKGGHSVIPFLKERFGDNSLNFGAIVIVSPTETMKELNSELSLRGYTCKHFEEGTRFYAPFAMGLYDQYVFLKKE